LNTDSIQVRARLRRSRFDLQVDVQLPGRGITAIFGRSGSGKTSLLRCLAGLEPDCDGEIAVCGTHWQDDGEFVPTHKRPIGYVIQTPSLFPHLNVRGNLQFAYKRAPTSSLSFERVIEMLALETLLDRNVDKLSGGERQRVAIGRALLIAPQLLLMDEPLASLDNQSKKEIMPFLERLHRELDIPVIYVSHSVEEVARLADYLLVMEKGRVVGQGQLDQMLARLDFPINLEDDAGVVWEGQLLEEDKRWHLSRVQTRGGDIWLRGSGLHTDASIRIRILARDVSLALSRHDDSSIINILSGEIEEILQEPEANSALVRVKVRESALLARLTLRSVDRLGLTPGMQIWAQIKSAALVT
jgi:molybdate transport system ATP-binding protein